MSATSTAIVGKGIRNIVGPVNAVAKSKIDIEPKLLLAMELFTSARLETTERSKFVGLVSSLEPLVYQEKYEDDRLERIIQHAIRDLSNCALPEPDLASLKGRIEQLRDESVSAAIRKMVRNVLPENHQALETIDEAYQIRSKMLHEGSTDADLSARGREVESVIRSLLERRMEPFLD